MPESRTWKGAAHDAATEMFRRATKRSSSFKTYAEAFADALRSGSSAIGKARTELLARADDIDAGPLRVTDQWVVMIDPAEMSEEEAAQLQKQASEMQTEINELLLAVGEADDWTALQLIAARAGKGAAFANLAYSAPSIVEPAPRDEVPDPSTEDGKLFQEIARAQDMATTIREVSETTDRYGNAVTTFHMVDGSEHIRTDWIDQGLPSQQIHPAGTIQILHVDKNKNWISDTTSMPREDGGNLTTVSWADGTTIAISQNPDGTRTGSCTTKTDYAILPDSFFPRLSSELGKCRALRTGGPGRERDQWFECTCTRWPQSGRKIRWTGDGRSPHGLQHLLGGHRIREVRRPMVRRRINRGWRSHDYCGRSHTGRRSDRSHGC